jgi:hypothetical protein
MQPRSQLESAIIDEWLKRHTGQRRKADVMAFYYDLQNRRPELLQFKSADPDKYQLLKTILRKHLED